MFRRLWHKVLDYVFPKNCLGCEREGEYLCSSCFDKMEYLDRFSCFICNSGAFESGICPDCQDKTGIDQIIVATKYSDNLAGKLVEELKYSYLEDIADSLGTVLVNQIEKKGLRTTIENKTIVPVPLHKKRFAERGFNQSEIILKNLINRYSLKLRKDLLIRQKSTAQQAKLERAERFSNLKDAFSANDKNSIPKEIILFDDVLTTGATFTEAVSALKKSGVERVVCLTVCHG
ncbi:ComF family protein [Candidatus Falkowbacteria bacterium]|nr:ComF family protein [Candidatus Falkowbacteria bacterium]MBT7007310.1 ComF family protein [Candidatus Falkowbacteria bacterium]